MRASVPMMLLLLLRKLWRRGCRHQ